MATKIETDEMQLRRFLHSILPSSALRMQLVGICKPQLMRGFQLKQTRSLQVNLYKQLNSKLLLVKRICNYVRPFVFGKICKAYQCIAFEFKYVMYYAIYSRQGLFKLHSVSCMNKTFGKFQNYEATLTSWKTTKMLEAVHK